MNAIIKAFRRWTPEEDEILAPYAAGMVLTTVMAHKLAEQFGRGYQGIITHVYDLRHRRRTTLEQATASRERRVGRATQPARVTGRLAGDNNASDLPALACVDNDWRPAGYQHDDGAWRYTISAAEISMMRAAVAAGLISSTTRRHLLGYVLLLRRAPSNSHKSHIVPLRR